MPRLVNVQMCVCIYRVGKKSPMKAEDPESRNINVSVL